MSHNGAQFAQSKNSLPYGGNLMNQAKIVNELIDHSQYQRVMKQPSAEGNESFKKPKWQLSQENRFNELKYRKSLRMEDLDEVKQMYASVGKIVPAYKKDDAFEWDDYERFALENGGTKLKDLNRKN